MKRSPMKPSRKKAPTKAEKERMHEIKTNGECMACEQELFTRRSCQPIEVHHLLDGGRRRGHRYTIGLCCWHHRGVPLDGYSKSETQSLCGPSLAEGSKLFHSFFGSDDVLLAMQDGWLLTKAD
jgi:Recombination enhancement, RecA-dependent nuclease